MVMKMQEINDSVIAKAMGETGQRLTRQKAEVLHHMQKNGKHHPTAEEVYFGVKRLMPTISLATIYNCLESLVSCKLLNRLSITGTPTHYEMRNEEHQHFRCMRCGSIIDIDAKIPLNQILSPDAGFEVTEVHLQLSGYCPKCKANRTANVEQKQEI